MGGAETGDDEYGEPSGAGGISREARAKSIGLTFVSHDEETAVVGIGDGVA